MDEELKGKEMMDAMHDLCKKQYMHGYKDGFQQGRMIGFDAGTKNGIKERGKR